MRLTKFECGICGESFDELDEAFDHLIDHHGDKLEAEYIIEV